MSYRYSEITVKGHLVTSLKGAGGGERVEWVHWRNILTNIQIYLE